MSTAEERARAAYYRSIYSLKELGAQSGQITPLLYTAGQNYLQSTLTRLSHPPQRLQAYRPETASQQRQYLREQYGDLRPHGLGVGQGEYIMLSDSDINDTRRFLATDFLVDCHALVLVARNAEGNVTQTLLAHVDAKTNLPHAIPELLAQMPQGSRIEATVLGSPNGYNQFFQADLLSELAKNPAVSRIRYNFDAATTVAVDTRTGHILTATGPIEPPETRQQIAEWPIDIQFRPFSNEAGLETGALYTHFFLLQRPVPTFDLINAYDPTKPADDPNKGFIAENDLSRFVLERQHNDGQLDATELHAIAARIGSALNAQITLDYALDDAGKATVNIIAPNGQQLDRFFSAKLDPSLGRSGRISER